MTAPADVGAAGQRGAEERRSSIARPRKTGRLLPRLQRRPQDEARSPKNLAVNVGRRPGRPAGAGYRSAASRHPSRAGEATAKLRTTRVTWRCLGGRALIPAARRAGATGTWGGAPPRRRTPPTPAGGGDVGEAGEFPRQTQADHPLKTRNSGQAQRSPAINRPEWPRVTRSTCRSGWNRKPRPTAWSSSNPPQETPPSASSDCRANSPKAAASQRAPRWSMATMGVARAGAQAPAPGQVSCQKRRRQIGEPAPGVNSKPSRQPWPTSPASIAERPGRLVLRYRGIHRAGKKAACSGRTMKRPGRETPETQLDGQPKPGRINGEQRPGVGAGPQGAGHPGRPPPPGMAARVHRSADHLPSTQAPRNHPTTARANPERPGAAAPGRHKRAASPKPSARRSADTRRVPGEPRPSTWGKAVIRKPKMKKSENAVEHDAAMHPGRRPEPRWAPAEGPGSAPCSSIARPPWPPEAGPSRRRT